MRNINYNLLPNSYLSSICSKSIPFCYYSSTYTCTQSRTILLLIGKAVVYAVNIYRDVITFTHVNYPKYGICCGPNMNVHVSFLRSWGICLYPICCLEMRTAFQRTSSQIRLDQTLNDLIKVNSSLFIEDSS